jgi:hypothetical protein
MKTRGWRSVIGRLLVISAIITGLSKLQQRLLCETNPARSSRCEPINTRLDGALVPCAESPVGFCAVGIVTSGLLKGTKQAVYLGISPSAGMPGVEHPTTLSYLGNQVFHTDQGDLHMSVIGVSDYERLVFTEVARVTGGTGRFANATGDLFISGTFAPDAVSFESTVTGEICLDHQSHVEAGNNIPPNLQPDRQPPLASHDSLVPCKPVNTQWDGTLIFRCAASPGGVCAQGTIHSGPLKGSTATIYFGMAPSAGLSNVEPPSTFSYSGTQVIHTAQGDLYASAVGIADSARHLFTEVSRITGGTGKFANATGNLFVSGTLSPDGVGFQSSVTGEICGTSR